jgi:hypothetical protein
MSIRGALTSLFRRPPPTDEEIAARAEAKAIRAEMNQDKLSQRNTAGMIYRSSRR